MRPAPTRTRKAGLASCGPRGRPLPEEATALTLSAATLPQASSLSDEGMCLLRQRPGDTSAPSIPTPMSVARSCSHVPHESEMHFSATHGSASTPGPPCSSGFCDEHFGAANECITPAMHYLLSTYYVHSAEHLLCAQTRSPCLHDQDMNACSSPRTECTDHVGPRETGKPWKGRRDQDRRQCGGHWGFSPPPPAPPSSLSVFRLSLV